MNTKFLTGLTAATAITGVLATAGVANAASISHTDTVERQSTDYTEDLSFTKFDSSLGTLQEVRFELLGEVFGTVQYESLDGTPTDVEATLAALLEVVGGPTGGIVIDAAPLISFNESATAFDGDFDFGGTSGNSFENIFATVSSNESYTDQASLDFFIGTGTVDLSLSAQADSKVNGSGNIASILNTEAGASLKVTYIYDSQSVPEPSAALGLGLIGGLGFLAKKKKSQIKA